MNKLLSAVFSIIVASTVIAGNAFAAYDYGQIGSGDIYRVRNVTDNQTSFVSQANADPCETVQFKVRVHNGGPKTVTNVKVKATLPTGISTTHASMVRVTADNNRDDAVATGTATVKLSKASGIKYVSGSTELLDTNGSKLQTLGDTILTSGVSIGSVGVSLNNMRFVQFQAKVNCEDAPVVKNIKVCEVATGNVVTIKEDAYDGSKYSKDLSDCDEEVVTEVAPVKELPKTGAGSVMLAGLGLGAMVVAGAYALQRRNILG